MRTKGRERCDRASPTRCSSCFPDISADKFLLRERFLKTLLGQVDLFIAPSRFIKERFVEWGLPAHAIDVVPNGRPAAEPAAHRPSPDGRRQVFGYFGNINPWKGVPSLLKAAQRLIATGHEDFELRLHGGAPFQAKEFVESIDAPDRGNRSSRRSSRPLPPRGDSRSHRGRRLGRRSVDLVGERASGDPGGFPPPPSGHHQQYRRHGRGGPRRNRRPACQAGRSDRPRQYDARAPWTTRSFGTTSSPASSPRRRSPRSPTDISQLYRGIGRRGEVIELKANAA